MISLVGSGTALAANISGRVFEDANFAGTASDWDGGVSDLALGNVDVELYDNANTFLATTNTAADGTFTFSGLANATYKVRVRSATVGDADTPAKGTFNACVPASCANPLPEMTWGNGAALYGGQSATVDDTATGDNAGPGDTYVSVTVSGADVANVNFGFAYNLIVNTSDDANALTARSKQGSLRQFIKNANAIGSAGGTTANSSRFRIPAALLVGGVATISPLSELPILSDGGTILDATTQTADIGDTNAAGPEVEIEGTSAGAARGFHILSTANNKIKGFVINRFSINGVAIRGAGADSNQVEGNYIGTDSTGTLARPNGPTPASTIDGNGVIIRQGGQSNTVGGPTAAERNVISGNLNLGVFITDSGTNNNVVIGNYIGTDRTGTAALPNGSATTNGWGVVVSQGAQNNRIGGSTVQEENIVAFNFREGVVFSDPGSTGNRAQKNLIRNNQLSGVWINTGANSSKIYQNTIYNNGTAAGAGNGDGIRIVAGITGTVAQNNLLTNNDGWGINDGSGAATIGYDDYFGNVSGACNGCAIGTGSITTDPQYVNAAGGNFSLTQCTSPAINAGTDLGVDQPDMNGATPGNYNGNAPEMGAYETVCITLSLVKQVWEVGGAAPLALTNGSPGSVTVPSGQTVVFLIYIKNPNPAAFSDIRFSDVLDVTAAGFDYVPGSLVRTAAASPPADTATDKQIFDATAPGTGTAMTDAADGDVASACDTGAGACPGSVLNRVTVGNTTGLAPAQANGPLALSANTTFAVRFRAVKK